MTSHFEEDNQATPLLILDPMAWLWGGPESIGGASATTSNGIALSDIVIVDEASGLTCEVEATGDVSPGNPFLSLCRSEPAVAVETDRDGLEVTTVGDVVMLRVS